MPPIVSEEHREERKKLILEAAKEVFIKKGFNAATIQDVINASGISRGGVYTYFENTEDIFIELLSRMEISQLLKSEGAGSNWGALMNMLNEIEDEIANQKNKLVHAIYEYYFTIGWKSKKHLPMLEKRVQEGVSAFAAIIRKGIGEGEFRPLMAPEAIAKSIITFCDGIYVTAFQLGPEKAEVKGQFEVLKSYLQKELNDMNGGSI
ncbi:TetR family transcriptional regulator [Bacillus sp. FJAT-27245]|uniref:TetR family transcriptional regulator n=1 Tax=Bacillus sp. FJAT-27245 TaxID=1684144 RepID=UPI0006A7CA7E|nr:TetR family transcriptional regulator [Bacillus sp. FJAT-27245]